MEFQAWPKTPRLFRDVVITEKIDGTNACIVIEPNGEDEANHVALANYQHDETGETWYQVGAQSRTRMITPENDNYGFARWVRDNARTLVLDLGPGRHFGEWWGQGIQRKYAMDRKVFSLFNVAKWGLARFVTPDLEVVPTLFAGPFSEVAVQNALRELELEGSVASPGFPDPEGVCVFHTASRQVYKYTLEGDGNKWQGH